MSDGLRETKEAPLRIETKSAQGSDPQAIGLFTSYSFERSIVTPAAAFRLTAPNVDKKKKLAIRSGDIISLQVQNQDGIFIPVATGIIDETDTHILPAASDYVISGRDMVGQLVDNAAVDAQNKIQNVTQVTLQTLMNILISGTRVPKTVVYQQTPNGSVLFQTNPGETKINLLQRYLEFMNCLVWSLPNGQITIGKPDFTSPTRGYLRLDDASPQQNNVLEVRVRRNVNHAIRQIVAQLSTLGQVDASSYTKLNTDPDMRKVRGSLVGRSVYEQFNYGSGQDVVNQATFVGNQPLVPRAVGDEYALRTIARENMKIIDVECIVPGHVNDLGQPYNIDQMYDVFISEEEVNEPMYVYGVAYELTLDHGMITRLKMCRKNTICAYGDATKRTQ